VAPLDRHRVGDCESGLNIPARLGQRCRRGQSRERTQIQEENQCKRCARDLSSRLCNKSPKVPSATKGCRGSL
jgi:hypothetical protein